MNASLAELTSLLAAIRGKYPKARVTSGYRGPESPLTQAHPNSFHAQGTPEDPGAVDVAPIPGVRFEDYVSSIRQAGVPIREAFDEAKHPFPWTTGPNWHLAQGQAPVAANQYYPQRPRTLGNMMPKPVLDAVPVDVGADKPLTLGTLLQPQLDAMPQGKVPDHKGLFHGKDWKAVLGILGDAMTAYGGGQPVYGPALLQRQRDEKQQDFEREKFSAALEAKRQEQPQFIENLQAWIALPDALKKQYLTYQDAANPIAISGPQGTQRVPRTLDDPNTKTVGDKTYHNINGQWFEETN